MLIDFYRRGKLKMQEIKFTNSVELLNNKTVDCKLKEAQKCARVRTVKNAKDLKFLVDNMILALNESVSKSYQNKCEVSGTIGDGQHFAKAYNGIPMGTNLRLIKHTSFYILQIKRDYVKTYGRGEWAIEFPNDEVKEIAVKQALKEFQLSHNVKFSL